MDDRHLLFGVSPPRRTSERLPVAWSIHDRFCHVCHKDATVHIRSSIPGRDDTSPFHGRPHEPENKEEVGEFQTDKFGQRHNRFATEGDSLDERFIKGGEI